MMYFYSISTKNAPDTTTMNIFNVEEQNLPYTCHFMILHCNEMGLFHCIYIWRQISIGWMPRNKSRKIAKTRPILAEFGQKIPLFSISPRARDNCLCLKGPRFNQNVFLLWFPSLNASQKGNIGGGESQILLDQHRERAGSHEFFWVKLVGGHEYFSDFVKNYSISLSVLWDLMTEYGGEKTSTVICFTMGCLKECFLGLFRYIIFLYIFSSFNLS